jgi:hypothetical protein
VAGSCEHYSENSVSVNVDQPSDYQLLKNNSAPLCLFRAIVSYPEYI